MFKLAHERKDMLLEEVKGVGTRVEVEELLFEPTPELLDGIEPRGVGG